VVDELLEEIKEQEGENFNQEAYDRGEKATSFMTKAATEGVYNTLGDIASEKGNQAGHKFVQSAIQTWALSLHLSI